MLIDFHTHLLPAIDDGSQSVAESLDMLETLRTQNVGCAVATPHFYSNRTGLTDFLHQRDKSYEMLHSECKNLGIKVIPGAEVSFFRGIGKAEELKQLCIADTNVLLLEMPFVQWTEHELTGFHRILDRGIIPVIAHVERYYPFQRNLSVFNEGINLPVFLQINAEALQVRRPRKFVFNLIENGFPILLGTDCHDMKKRKPDLLPGREILIRKYGIAYLEGMDAQGTELLRLDNASAN